jgi:aldose 1-epimerase
MLQTRKLFLATLFLSIAEALLAGEVQEATEFDQPILILSQGKTVAKLAPQSGANLYSIQIDGIEVLHQPANAKQLAGVSCGVPVLYPTPNRVRNASFTFRGQTVSFEKNAGENFIHGLVNRHPWKVIDRGSDAASAYVRCLASFEAGGELHQRFPFPHRMYLDITVRDRSIRWQYTIDNRKSDNGSQAVPYGFALHPYFRYLDDRSATYLSIPATHWMESTKQLPSGKLIPAEQLDFPLNEPLSLHGKSFDDVFYGLQPDSPTRIEFRDKAWETIIRASQEFTHLVVWTPDRPYFGVESQTCSTDAHNLDAKGFHQAAHLQVCEPGQQQSGWVEYQFPAR